MYNIVIPSKDDLFKLGIISTFAYESYSNDAYDKIFKHTLNCIRRNLEKSVTKSFTLHDFLSADQKVRLQHKYPGISLDNLIFYIARNHEQLTRSAGYILNELPKSNGTKNYTISLICNNGKNVKSGKKFVSAVVNSDLINILTSNLNYEFGGNNILGKDNDTENLENKLIAKNKFIERTHTEVKFNARNSIKNDKIIENYSKKKTEKIGIHLFEIRNKIVIDNRCRFPDKFGLSNNNFVKASDIDISKMINLPQEYGLYNFNRHVFNHIKNVFINDNNTSNLSIYSNPTLLCSVDLDTVIKKNEYGYAYSDYSDNILSKTFLNADLHNNIYEIKYIDLHKIDDKEFFIHAWFGSNKYFYLFISDSEIFDISRIIYVLSARKNLKANCSFLRKDCFNLLYRNDNLFEVHGFKEAFNLKNNINE
jgi:hypothetical protein